MMDVVIFFFIMIILLFPVMYRYKKLKKEAVGKVFIKIDRFANYYGLYSKGSKQVRGTGVLVLESNKIRFDMYFPPKVIEIDLKDIREIEIAYSHIGKIGIRLLKLHFKDGFSDDSVAWSVSGVDKWITAILKVKNG